MNEKKRTIEVVAYDPRWLEEFRKESHRISEVLTDQIVHIHHIGSTAVPGLKAKPVIDIMLEVKDVDDLDEYDSGMEHIGYIPKGEFGITGRRFYLKGLQNPTHHVHAFNAGSPHVHRHIAFRDYLVEHPLIAKEYEELKIRCADECDNDNEKYCDGKEDFVREHEKKAMAWMTCQQPH
jgi:GrpB-like predicted nucleotidyltransferase (UPF0157 family)